MSGGSSGGSPPLRRKIVVLGFRGIGKTAVTTHFVEGRFTEKYDPTIEGNYEHRVKISNAVFDVQIIDTAGMVRAATESVRNQQGTHTEGTHTEDRLRGHAVPCIGAAHGRFRAQTKPHDPHTAPRGLQSFPVPLHLSLSHLLTLPPSPHTAPPVSTATGRVLEHFTAGLRRCGRVPFAVLHRLAQLS